MTKSSPGISRRNLASLDTSVSSIMHTTPLTMLLEQSYNTIITAHTYPGRGSKRAVRPQAPRPLVKPGTPLPENLSAEDLDKLRVDLDFMMAHYEGELKKPIRNLVSGRLPRTLLIQVPPPPPPSPSPITPCHHLISRRAQLVIPMIDHKSISDHSLTSELSAGSGSG